MTRCSQSFDAAELLPWSWLGRLDYDNTPALFEQARNEVLAGAHERLYLCEHPPVITLGRHADTANITATSEVLDGAGVAVCHTDRGGDVTYHGPGQLMIYPVVRIGISVASFVSNIAGALAAACAELGAPGAEWHSEPAGLWWRERKLAACGLRVHRGVVTHGFALNVDTPKSAWSSIVPCGLRDRRPVSLREILAGERSSVAVDVASVAPVVAEHVAAVLGRRPLSQG
jgi:lipoyl(octanoyl) transferase